MIDELTKDFLFKISNELKKEENRTAIKNEIIEPLFNEISAKIYPYISILFGMYCINLILIIIILLMILLKKNN